MIFMSFESQHMRLPTSNQ